MKVFRANEYRLPREIRARSVTLAPRGTSGERAGERGFIRSPCSFTEEICHALITKSHVACLGILLAAMSVQVLGDFQNMDFENPIEPLVPAADSTISTTDGVPGWTVYLGSDPDTRMPYNTSSIGAPSVALRGPGSQYVLQGNYTVLLQGEWHDQLIPASIAQTGQIPTDSLSVVFDLFTYSNIELSFAGHAIPLVQIGSEPGYNIVGGDISAFAGVTGELRFTAQGNKDGLIDDIRFSTEALVVPEPATAVLFAMGALALAGRFGRRKS
jgi:hypothetical protein